jgi:hypothetical protein
MHGVQCSAFAAEKVTAQSRLVIRGHFDLPNRSHASEGRSPLPKDIQRRMSISAISSQILNLKNSPADDTKIHCTNPAVG